MILRDYSVFGLRVRSELELPELILARTTGDPDVHVRRADIDADPSEPGTAVHAGGLLLTIDNVGRFLVSDGREVCVEAKDGVDPRNVRLFLLGSAFGALLHQRDLLPLHANAVDIDGQAVAFTGESGAGKSTLAAWFHDRGFPILADDVCVISVDNQGAPVAFPGLPRLRLWLDALESTGRSTDGLQRSVADLESPLEKYDLPLAEERMADRQSALATIYLLAKGDGFAIQRLEGIDATQAIFDNTYRGAFVAMARRQGAHWKSAVELARKVAVFRVERSYDRTNFEAECLALLDHARIQRR